MAAVDILSRNGIHYNAAALITASSRTGVPLWIAAAFVQHESGGANVYGHDAGGAMSGAGAVTEANFKTFLAMIRAGHTSNGVGPLQITYAGYFPQAASEGYDLANPVDNMVFGLNIIRGYLGGNYSDTSINQAGQRYNSGRPNGAPEYGALTVQYAHRWKTLLGTTPTPSTKLVVDGIFGKASTERAQHWLGTPVDGVISSQDVDRKTNFPVANWPTVQWVSAAKGSQWVGKLQAKLGVKADGILGPATAKALQIFLGFKGSDVDGIAGVKTVKTLQTYLNSH